MNSFYVRSWWVAALRGVLGILFGVLALMWPGLTLLTLVALFAAYAMLGGTASVIGAISHRKVDDDWWIPLLLGLVSIGAAVVAVVNPVLTTLVLVMVIAANALVSGVLDIVAAARLRRELHGEWMLALSGIASVVFGALVFLYPLAGAIAMVWLISIYAIINGALLLSLAIRARTVTARAQARPAVERRVLPDRRMAGAH
ncbi:HdeD family acid-resistance protein [Massilia solisilvae]|uniref:HdeD family acid-resistance protein n=1 Tax=Massilia solisilvae TaxID=1811225 RepID=A0ABT2BML3_9BURK|nr:HdeD family acid-resistance protein [Massilia solisilvae]MCS0609761.1 HdeD family acid-resistance protein [Massilia solisilvae]